MKRGYDDGDILGTRRPKDIPVKKKKTQEIKSSGGVVVKVDPRKHIQIQVDKLNEDQMRRYTAWKTSVFSPEHILDIMSNYSSVKLSDLHVSMVAACAKNLVGELVEDVRIHRGDTGVPVTSEDIELSYRRLSNKRILPDCCPILKRRYHKIPKPEKPFDPWSLF